MKLQTIVFRATLIASSLCLAAVSVRAATSTPTVTPTATTAPATMPAHEGLFRKISADLKLTPEQKKELKAIIQPFHEKMESWRTAHKDELQKIRADFKAAREAKDKEKAQAALKEFKTLWESAPHVKDILPQIKSILTPEQLETVKERLEQWRESHAGALRRILEERREERREHRGEHPTTQPSTTK